MIAKKHLTNLILGASILCLSTSFCHAGWVDDWMTQSTGSSPGYFEGQQRGYYSGGSFSGRWPSTADYPVTIEAPRVKSGCGGIDVFMGGFSFMNTDYLVNKLQSILTNAPAVAFDLGLKTLCEQCSNSIKNFEALADNLNSMQLSECGAAKELVGVVMDENGFHSSEVMQEKVGTAIKENKLVSGASEMWDILTKADRANNNQIKPADVAAITSGCNAEIKNVFLTGNSMLENVGAKMSIPPAHLDLIRGLIGDLKLEGPAAAYKVSYMPPCSENNPDTINTFTSGSVYRKNTAGVCSQITDTNRDLVAHFNTNLSGIAVKLRNKTALTVSEQTFLDTNPLSALPILKTAVATNTEDAVIGGLSNITAQAFTLQMFSDLYVRAEMVARKAKEMLEKQAAATGGQGPEKCAAVIFATHADQDISIMLHKIDQLKVASKSNYVAAAQEMNTILAYMEHMQNIESQMHAELTRRYGKDMTARLRM